MSEMIFSLGDHVIV